MPIDPSQFSGGLKPISGNLRPLGSPPPQEPQKELSFSFGKTAANIIPSALNLFGGIVESVVHPINTVRTLGSVAVGGVEKLIPGEQGQEKSFNALTSMYKERYGSVDKLLKTIQDDPVGFASDAAVFLSGGGTAVTKLGTVSRLSALEKVGSVASSLSKIADPMRIPTTVVRATQKTGSAISEIMPKGKPLGFVDTAPDAEVVMKINPSPKLQKTLPDISKDLIKSSFRLSQKEAAKLGESLDSAADIAYRYKISGSPAQRVEKIDTVYHKMEAQFQKAIGHVAGGAKTETVIQDLENLKGAWANHIEQAEAAARIDKAIAVLKNKGKSISYSDLNDIKRSAWDSAYGTQGGVVDEVSHSIGDTLKERIVKDLDGIGIDAPALKQSIPIDLFNREYGNIIMTRKLLKLAEQRTQISGVSARLVGALLGQTIAPGAFGIIGGSLMSPYLNALPVTAVKTGVAVPLGRTVETIKGAASKSSIPLQAAQKITESRE